MCVKPASKRIPHACPPRAGRAVHAPLCLTRGVAQTRVPWQGPPRNNIACRSCRELARAACGRGFTSPSLGRPDREPGAGRGSACTWGGRLCGVGPEKVRPHQVSELHNRGRGVCTLRHWRTCGTRVCGRRVCGRVRFRRRSGPSGRVAGSLATASGSLERRATRRPPVNAPSYVMWTSPTGGLLRGLPKGLRSKPPAG